MHHITVLQQTAVDILAFREHDTVVDATFGSGGHATVITSRLGKEGCYIGIDADSTAFQNAPPTYARCTVHLVHDNFRNIDAILRSLHITHVNAILADLGWRMDQFTNGSKGFSFSEDEPLLMTYGDPESYDFTAYDIVNSWDETSIADIIFGYGEERAARRIAKAIVTARKINPILTSKQLAHIIAPEGKKERSKLHPATKTFQALRIAVNDELGALQQLIDDGFKALARGGTMAIITFHSLEDRIVKRSFKALATSGEVSSITKKPLVPTAEEIRKNPRARSAKLRVITKQP